MSSEAIDTLDLTDLRCNCGQDVVFIKRIISLFVKQSRVDIVLLKNAVNDCDLNAWSLAAHSLKGSAGNIGAKKLYELADMAQRLAPTQKERMPEILSEVIARHKTVLDLLEKEGVYEPVERGEVGPYTGG